MLNSTCPLVLIILSFTHQGTKGQISKVFSALLAIHSDKPGTEDAFGAALFEKTYRYMLSSKYNAGCYFVVVVACLALWIMAAKSELEDRDSSESARHLFLRALRFHPNNKKVYQEVKGAKCVCKKYFQGKLCWKACFTVLLHVVNACGKNDDCDMDICQIHYIDVL